MMARKNIFYVILLALMLGGIIMGRFLAPDNTIIERPALAHDFLTPMPQRVSERIWKSPPTHKLLMIRTQDDGFPRGPNMLKIYEDQGIYIFDYGDLALKKFSHEGILLQKYGKGGGQGPGEFSNPTDFVVTEEGLLWIADPVNGVLSVFNADGSLIRTIHTLSRPYRLLLYGAENMIIMPESGEYLFEIYKTGGERIDTFGKIIENQQANVLALDGLIARSNMDSFFYVPFYAGFILSYTINKQLRFYVQMIDPKPLPKIIKSATGRTHVDRKASYAALSINTAGNELFIISDDQSRGEGKRRVIDVYSNETGSYLYSMPVPEPCNQIFVTKNYMYTLNMAGLSKWQK